MAKRQFNIRLSDDAIELVGLLAAESGGVTGAFERLLADAAATRMRGDPEHPIDPFFLMHLGAERVLRYFARFLSAKRADGRWRFEKPPAAGWWEQHCVGGWGLMNACEVYTDDGKRYDFGLIDGHGQDELDLVCEEYPRATEKKVGD